MPLSVADEISIRKQVQDARMHFVSTRLFAEENRLQISVRKEGRGMSASAWGPKTWDELPIGEREVVIGRAITILSDPIRD